MITNGIFSSATDNWATPQWLFDELNREFHFTLDPCASEENHKCEKYYTKADDGLSEDWGCETVFCNPPYGKKIGLWVEKCYKHAQAGATCVMLLPARTDTRWFHKFIYGKSEIRFLQGRLRFGDVKDNAPFPSMIVVYKNIKTEDEQPADDVAPRWIPVKFRPMNSEEREYWEEQFGEEIANEDAVIFDCPMPEDGQEILVSYRKWISMDKCEIDGGCYGLEGNGDWDGVIAWMPLPEPYKEGEQNG